MKQEQRRSTDQPAFPDGESQTDRTDRRSPVKSGLRRLTVTVQRFFSRYPALIVFFLLPVWVLPGILLSRIDYTLEYDYIQNVRVAASMNYDFLLPLNFSGFNFFPEHQGSELIKLMLSKVTGITVQQLQVFPLGSLLLPLAFYFLCREYTDHWIAALLSISIAYDPTVVLGSYHTTVYSWSHPLLILMLFLYIKILRKKTSAIVLLIMLVFISLFSIYWTESALIISFTVFINLQIILPWFWRTRNRAPLPKTQTLSMAAAFLVVYLFFGEFIYHLIPNFIGQEVGGQFGSAIISLSKRILQLVGLIQPDEAVYATYGGASSFLVIQLIRYGIIILPVAWLVVVNVRNLLARRPGHWGKDIAHQIIWTLVAVLIFHTLIYSSYGHASTRYVALLGPLIALMALDIWRVGNRLKGLYAALIGALACIGFFLSLPQAPQHATWDEVRPAVDWFVAKSETQQMLTNVGLYGMFAMESSSQKLLPKYECFSEDSYNRVIDLPGEGQPLDPGYYLVVDKRVNTHEMCPGFHYFEPLSGHLPQVDSNRSLQSIYDNGFIWILKPVEAPGKE
jgi:hypothetical protein